jgi:hypothetical protein
MFRAEETGMTPPVAEPCPITFDPLYAAIGCIFVLWARVEQALRAGILALEADGNTAQARKSHRVRYEDWQALVRGKGPYDDNVHGCLAEIGARFDFQRDLRNHLAHGIRGAHLEHPTSRDSGVVLTELNGVPRQVTLAEPERAHRSLDHLATAIHALSDAVALLDPQRRKDACQGIRQNHLL